MKKGFTLIELLAVIVILAIIALIAVPIVINIIDDSKKNASLRSADFYLDAVEMSVAQATLKNQNIPDDTYNILPSGNICIKYKTGTTTCEEELVVEVNGEVPKEGTIVISGGEILHSEIKLNEKEIIKDSRGEIAYAKTLEEVCTYVKEDNTTPKTAGAKYNCKVDPKKDSYTFYVLTTPQSTDESINLIMDRNINSDGTPVTKAIEKENAENGVYNKVAWVSKEDYNDDTNYGTDGNNNKGPITAMNFLSEATKTWINTNEMIIKSFTDKDGVSHDMQTYNTYARMPYKSEVADSNGTNEYLYENLAGIGSYLTLSSAAIGTEYAFILTSYGVVHSAMFVKDTTGVRPVINLNL